ncbi:MAG: type I restriction endonuclease subunit S [Clostridia bacterium]|nr:type I restriction endonuclease subunit S [Clostridia bacterium]
MNKINTTYWQEYRIGNLFDIHPTKAYKLTNSSLFEKDGVNPVVVNSSFNNGIGGYTNQPVTEEGNIITFSDTTTATAMFYQAKPFVGYAHIQGMYPIGAYKEKWNENSLLFFLSVFRNRAINSNFDYVNKFTRESAKEMTIKLPADKDGNPDFSYMEEYMKNREIAVSASLTKLQSAKRSAICQKFDTKDWQTFHLYDIFEIDSGTKLDKAKMDTTTPKINFVGRSNFNNGITQKVNEIQGLNPYDSGCLTLALGGAYLGSCFIQEEPFYTSQNVVVLIPKENITFEAKQFIATAIFKESQNNYQAFIKELNAHIKKDFVIKLPAKTDGTPDYDYMTVYISEIKKKSLHAFEALQAV